MLLTASIGLAPIAGCESLPGNEKQQGAVIGGVGGALAGAAVSKDNRAVGALIGAALGAGGGYLIGANVEKNKDKSDEQIRTDANQASQNAQKNPATAADVAKSKTADVNEDGFVTLDEVVAMRKADLSEKEMIRRLERTQQYFQLTPQQQQYLRDNGVAERVIEAMRDMKPNDPQLASDKTDKQEKPKDVDLRTNPR
jgi:hypothetical protein